MDHNTYKLFDLEDGVPTDEYSLDAAIKDKYLVPSKPVSVPLKFLREGIKYDDLSAGEVDIRDQARWVSAGCSVRLANAHSKVPLLSR